MREENPPALGLCLELDLSFRFVEGQPIPCHLMLGRFPMDHTKRGRPPGARALRAFTLEFRRRAAARFPGIVHATQPGPQFSEGRQLREAHR